MFIGNCQAVQPFTTVVYFYPCHLSKWGQDGGLRTVLLGKCSSTSILGGGGGGNPWLLFMREKLLTQYHHFAGLSQPCQMHAVYECRAIYTCTVAYMYLHNTKHVLSFLFIGKECFCNLFSF